MFPNTAAASLLVATFARADEGRIPIFQPTTITSSGSYILTRNITVPLGVVRFSSVNAAHPRSVRIQSDLLRLFRRQRHSRRLDRLGQLRLRVPILSQAPA